MHRAHSLSVLIAPALLAACVVVAGASACSSSGRPPASSGTGDASIEDVRPSPSDDAGIDDASPEADIATCPPPPVQDGPIVINEFVAADRPAAVGGIIQPGRYHLTKREYFSGAGGRTGPIGTIIQRTVLFTDRFMVYVEGEGTVDAGIEEGDTQGKLYESRGTSLRLVNECSTAPGTFPTGDVDYSVVGTEVHLLISATQREILSRIGN